MNILQQADYTDFSKHDTLMQILMRFIKECDMYGNFIDGMKKKRTKINRRIEYAIKNCCVNHLILDCIEIISSKNLDIAKKQMLYLLWIIFCETKDLEGDSSILMDELEWAKRYTSIKYSILKELEQKYHDLK